MGEALVRMAEHRGATLVAHMGLLVNTFLATMHDDLASIRSSWYST